jgi:hypothetical protein
MSTTQNLSSNGAAEHFVTVDGAVRHVGLTIDLEDRLTVEFIFLFFFLVLLAGEVHPIR